MYVDGEMRSVGKLCGRIELVYWLTGAVEVFPNMPEKCIENRGMKEKCAEEDWFFEGTF